MFLIDRLRVLDRSCAQRPGCREPCRGRTGDADARHQLGRQRGDHAQVGHAVVRALEGDRPLAPEEPLDNECVLDHAVVAFVVRRVIVQRRQIVGEATGHHVEEHAPAVQVGKGGDQLRRRVGMQVEGLDGHERAELVGQL